MRTLSAAWLFVTVTLFAAEARPATTVTVTGADGPAEVCRFEAADADDPFQRWLTSPKLTCSDATNPVEIPQGLWNVFARSKGKISTEQLLVDGGRSRALSLSLAQAASLDAQLPPGHTAVVYAPKQVAAWPLAGPTTVPADEELWLFVVSSSKPVAIVRVPAIQGGGVRTVDARAAAAKPSVVGWPAVPDQDRSILTTAHGVSNPTIRVSGGGKESTASPLPAPDKLHGSFVLFEGLTSGDAQLELSGRGWLRARRSFKIAPEPLTPLYQAIDARASATLTVNWSTTDNLPDLERSIGSCNPSPDPPQFTLTISSCAAPPPGRPSNEATCQAMRKEPLELIARYGTVTLQEVPPGFYRAELRFGRLPPVSVESVLLPLQQQPIWLQASYIRAYGGLTRGGKPLGDGARITFPGGTGFAREDDGEYNAVLLFATGREAKVQIETCRGERAFVLTDRAMARTGGRYDLDIPDNLLTVDVVDTFTRMPIAGARVKMTVMSAEVTLPGRSSARLPRRPVMSAVLQTGDEQDRRPGRFVVNGVPEREIRLEASASRYKTQQAEPFTMGKTDKKEIEIQLVPLSGFEAKILSAHPFEKATIYWYSGSSETERAELASDGTFIFESPHYRGETMTVVSLSHPLWILPAPPVERAKPLTLRFPDSATVRNFEVWLPSFSSRLSTAIGLSIGGLRLPAAALAEHMALRETAPYVAGPGPLRIPSIAETGPIDVHRGPSVSPSPYIAPAYLVRDFAPVATRRLQPGSDRVVLDGK